MTIYSNTQQSFVHYLNCESYPLQPRPRRDKVLYLEKMKKRILKVYDQEVKHWLDAMDLYDQEITAHTLRVTALSIQLGRVLGLKDEDLKQIQYGTLMHDIGKLGVPDSIIRKPGRLSEDEYRVVQMHPLYAHEWIKKCMHEKTAQDIPLFHHERWDGNGYPYHLKGDEIPLLARVVAVVDVWDAITSDRPYRLAMSRDQAVEHLKAETGKHFEPEIVRAFLGTGIQEKQAIDYTAMLIT